MSKITEKIAKLLALAESPYEEEAKAALLQARRLMAEHKLMPEDIEPQENKKVIQECVGVTCTKLSSPWTLPLHAHCRTLLLQALSEFRTRQQGFGDRVYRHGGRLQALQAGVSLRL